MAQRRRKAVVPDDQSGETSGKTVVCYLWQTNDNRGILPRCKEQTERFRTAADADKGFTEVVAITADSGVGLYPSDYSGALLS